VNGIDLTGLGRYLLRHPTVAPVVLLAGWRLRANKWWRHAPFLPLPDQKYWNFRRMTATGSTDGAMSVREIVDAARWSSRQRVGR
jgi:hypothetical protein